MSSWLDLINIGIDVTQSYQIYKARQKLDQIESGAAAETLRREVLEVLRNFVFETAQDMKALEQRVAGSPQPVYVVARALEWRFQDIGISPGIFPEFADKEYVLQVQEVIGKVTQEAQGRLSETQVRQAEECVNAIVQMPLLEQAIEAQAAREQLQAVEEEWQNVSSEKSRRTLQGIGTLAVSWFACPVMACIGSPVLGSLAIRVNENLVSLVGGGAMVLTLLVMLAGSIGGIILLGKSSTRRHAELKKARKAWQGKVPGQEVWNEIVTTFGKQSSDGYRNMRAAHQNLMREVLAQVEGFDKFLPATA
jgi:predicted phage tail protein